MKKTVQILVSTIIISISGIAQNKINWINVDSLYQPLPASVHIYKTTDSLDGKPNIAYYLIADLKDKNLNFTADTTYKRRLTPKQFYEKNNQPLAVVNCTFFSFETNQNLNVVIKNGRLVSRNVSSIRSKGKDSFMYVHAFGSAFGINKKRKADIAWLFTDSISKYAFASQQPLATIKDTIVNPTVKNIIKQISTPNRGNNVPFKKWKMQAAVGGGPVLVQQGEIKITNEEETKFTGKAINDKHPRTAMGYTADNKLIILVVQGRFTGLAEGATLTQEAEILKDLGCIEALNLDGGGSSCLLVNGKETIKPSDKEGIQRAVPAVFIIQKQ